MAVDMFMKIDGVPGETKDAKHPNEIEVLAWSWGMSNSSSFGSGGGGGAGKVNIQDLSFTKYVDVSSHALMLRCATGEHIKSCNLIIRKAGKTQQEYIKLTLDEVMVTSVSTGGSGGEDRLTENVSLTFAKVKFEYAPQKADGSLDAYKPMGWDQTKNVKF